jgi:diadenosine tetraphosphate (Ap4A) HIT family hydrolase
MDNPNVNFVCNQGYAQAVHHVHFHLVPAPIFDTSSIFSTSTPAPQPTTATPKVTSVDQEPVIPRSKTPPTTEAIVTMERENREELDQNDAVKIAERIRSRL